MSAFTLRWCKEHGYWDDDVDSPAEACPTCIESGAFKTRAQLERELAKALKYEQDNARERSLFLQRAERAEAKLAALLADRPDVAGLVDAYDAARYRFEEWDGDVLVSEEHAELKRRVDAKNVARQRILDALLSLSAQLAVTMERAGNAEIAHNAECVHSQAMREQLAEKEAENVKLRGAVPCCQDFDNCTQRCFPRAEHFKAECEGLNREVFQLGAWLIRVRQQMFPAHDQKAIIHKEFPRFAALDSARARKP